MVTNLAKNTSAVSGQNKIGSGWIYNEPDLSYEMSILYYNSYGNTISVTNLAKNTASITNQTKS